jgi:hypothetical protein
VKENVKYVGLHMWFGWENKKRTKILMGEEVHLEDQEAEGEKTLTYIFRK